MVTDNQIPEQQKDNADLERVDPVSENFSKIDKVEAYKTPEIPVSDMELTEL